VRTIDGQIGRSIPMRRAITPLARCLAAIESHHDAERVLEVLGKRLERYGLTLHPDKTRFIDFRPALTASQALLHRTVAISVGAL
jgi:hypothetical protein